MEAFNSNVIFDSEKLAEAIMKLNGAYPFITVNSIGKSVLGKTIHEIRIGNGPKKIHMNASFHANEWITTTTLMSLINTYCLSISNGVFIREYDPLYLYQNVELSVVPMVNPDGVDLVLKGPPLNQEENVIKINGGSSDFIHWKANIRGVDLNRQFPANWRLAMNKSPTIHPSSRDYPGKTPLTEPEAIAMASLAWNTAFDYILAFHTQGEEIYWGYEGLEPRESEEMALQLEMASGYKAVQYVDSHAGYKDWFIQEFGRPGFTIELGRGINPLPMSQFKEILKRAEAIFFTALIMK